MLKIRISRFFFRFVCVLVLFLTRESAAWSQARVVAVGDIHGAYPEFVSILRRVGLIDGDRNWIGGLAVLVQTGDVPDRGPATRQCLDLLIQLEQQAEKQNGKVIPLLGNHEVMTLMGDVRYASVEEFRTFATDQSEKVREEAYRDYRKFLSGQPNHPRARSPDDEGARQKWFADHPLGFFERRDAFGPKGLYGQWVRKHDIVAQVGDVLFMHGGLNPKLHFRNIKELNDRVRSELATFDALWESLSEKKIIWRYMTLDEALRQTQEALAETQTLGGEVNSPAANEIRKLLGLPNWLIVSPDGPLWYRGLALDPEEKLSRDVQKMLARIKANYIVAAHTVRPKFDVTARFDNHVFLIDTGMLRSVFGGRASALEIEGGRFRAFYADADQPVVLLAPGEARTTSSHSGNGEREHQP